VAEACSALDIDLQQPLDSLASRFVEQVWRYTNERWKLVGGSAGDVAEILIALSFVRSGIRPFIMVGESSVIPTHTVDFWVETKEHGPIVVSSNTVVKERWKHENLAAYVLKTAVSGAGWYVVTMQSNDARGVSRKIDDLTAKYLDGAACARDTDFDELLQRLSSSTCVSPSTELVSGRLVR
jgi:hypothetical protein